MWLKATNFTHSLWRLNIYSAVKSTIKSISRTSKRSASEINWHLNDWNKHQLTSGPVSFWTCICWYIYHPWTHWFWPYDCYFVLVSFADAVSGGQFTIIVKTYGTVKYQNRKAKTFHQNFMLTSQNNVWKIVSDSFRHQEWGTVLK